MEKYLFHKEPMITSFPSTALIMMMFQENLDQYKPWLANHFLKLVGILISTMRRGYIFA